MRIPLSIATRYVPSWGVWEAVREIVQNGLDEADRGFPLKIEHRALAIRVSNAEARLERSTLLLGGGDKADSGLRGKFGEGYKLALLVCVRLKKPVRIWTGIGEIWAPSLESSAVFGGAETLVIDVRSSSRVDGVVVEIGGIDDATWATIKSRILALSPPKPEEVIHTDRGRILLSPAYHGQLYCRGLWVGLLPDTYAFGYDLDLLSLDRDRKMAEPWSLRYEIGTAIADAAHRKRLTTDHLTAALAYPGERAAIANRCRIVTKRYHGPVAW